MRRSLIVIISLAFALAAMAETHYKPHISVGAHAGADVSKVAFSPSVKQNWEQGLTGGVSIRYAEERLVGVLAEVNFVQRGWSEKFEESPLSYHRKINYVSVPIMSHIYFGPDRFKCFFNLGPEFCYMLSESTDANFDINNPLADDRWPMESRMIDQLTTPVHSKFDYGICVGFGCEFWLRPRHSAYIEARYYFGLGNIFPATKADVFSGSRNNTVTLTLGYNFRLK